VLTFAVLSVESRMHNQAWQNIAISRGAQCDAIASLLRQPAIQSVSSSRELTLDVGWFLERVLEIIVGPNVMESGGQQDWHSLINLDKRRYAIVLLWLFVIAYILLRQLGALSSPCRRVIAGRASCARRSRA
jgi:hypothetical protein